MRLGLVAVGRLKAGAERDLAERYGERAAAHARALGLSGVETREVAVSRAARAEERRAEEAHAILAAMPAGARLALLDERGQPLDSAQWATDIGKARDGGAPAYVIVIGGPDGLDPSLRERAGVVVSFGRVTWPHALMRVLATEQLYRALTILGGHPYHRA